MTFEIKPGDVVIVVNSRDEEHCALVQRITKTQIITEVLAGKRKSAGGFSFSFL